MCKALSLTEPCIALHHSMLRVHIDMNQDVERQAVLHTYPLSLEHCILHLQHAGCATPTSLRRTSPFLPPEDQHAMQSSAGYATKDNSPCTDTCHPVHTSFTVCKVMPVADTSAKRRLPHRPASTFAPPGTCDSLPQMARTSIIKQNSGDRKPVTVMFKGGRTSFYF